MLELLSFFQILHRLVLITYNMLTPIIYFRALWNSLTLTLTMIDKYHSMKQKHIFSPDHQGILMDMEHYVFSELLDRLWNKKRKFISILFRKFNTAKAQPAWFMSMDTDDDGFISPSEFDGSSQLTEDVLNWIEMKRSRS